MAFFNFKNGSKNQLPSEDKIKVGGSYSIKVFGTGCKACKALFENLKTAVDSLEISADIQHITDISRLAANGIMITPALVINGKTVSSGKILKAEEIKKLIIEFQGDK